MIEDMVMTATITTIDTLILHVVYVRMAEGPGSGAKAWVGLGCAIKLAQTVCFSTMVVISTEVLFSWDCSTPIYSRPVTF